MSDDYLPDCMMPDGGQCCAGYTRQRQRIEALEAALHKIDDITIDHTAMGIARKALASAARAPEQDKPKDTSVEDTIEAIKDKHR